MVQLYLLRPLNRSFLFFFGGHEGRKFRKNLGTQRFLQLVIPVQRKRPGNTLALGCSGLSQELAGHFPALLLCQAVRFLFLKVFLPGEDEPK